MSLAGELIFAGYFAALSLFSLFGLYKLGLLILYLKNRSKVPEPASRFQDLPRVTIQLPIFNEMYVARRLIEAACNLDYPDHLLEVQVLDDSTDETVDLTRQIAVEMRGKGKDVVHIHREDRVDFKAGALANGLHCAKGKYVAIFDADFVPGPDFLMQTIHYFTEPEVGMVQARWGFLNEGLSLLTRIQRIFLNGHFVIEHTSRHRAGRFFNFNGTAGIWRKEAIQTAGGWQGDTLTEDLDLSYRAQLKGWRFVYLKDLVVPSELPVEIGGFKGQQFRWVKGMTQVGIKLLPQIWRSRQTLARKIDATCHLLSNTGYITTTLMATLVMPTLFLFGHFFRNWFFLVAFYFLLTNLAIVFAYFVVAESEVQNKGIRKWLDALLLMVAGIGLSINGTKAIFEAVRGKRTPFVRTPKYSSQGARKQKWHLKKYRTRVDGTLVVEALLSVYFFFFSYLVFRSGSFHLLIPLLFFGTGYFYLTFLSLHSRFLEHKTSPRTV